jgi:hypothetical protein
VIVRGRVGSLFTLTAAAGVLAVLSGCSPSGPAGSAATVTASADATAEPSGEPTHDPTPEPEPTLDPDGSAEQNRAYFDLVNQRLLEEQQAPDGRRFIDNLIAAGFAREAMEVTPDRTAVGLAADNIQFSVRMGDQCLLGQFGNTGYVIDVAEVLSTGRCLVGDTRPIDW